jgi:hypothetical protein
MKFRFHISCLAFALAVAGSIVTPARADESNKETRMQTNAPLEIPGHMLEPGTYIFRLADSLSNRNIVQVFSEDATGKQTFVTTLLAISAYRLLTPDKPIFNMEERPAGNPEAIQSWFYPGDNTGWEFVYSKSDRIETAQNHAPAEQPAPAAVEPPKPPAEPVAAPEAEPEPVEEAFVEEIVVAETDTVVSAPENTPEIPGAADRELPQTAGYSAAELLAGMTMLSLGGLILFVALRRNAA